MKTFAVMLACSLLCLCGCAGGDPTLKKIDPTVLALVKDAADAATVYGLSELAKKDPTVAASVAVGTSSSIADNILPYLKSQGQLKTAKEVEDYLSTAMCDKLPAQVKLAIISAFGVLDLYLPVPDAKTYLTADQINLLCAFMGGVAAGCQQSEGAGMRSCTKPADNPSKKWFKK